MSRVPNPSLSPDHEATNYIKWTFTSRKPNSEHRPHKISVPETEAMGGSSEAAPWRENLATESQRWQLLTHGPWRTQSLCPALGPGPLGQEAEGRSAFWS